MEKYLDFEHVPVVYRDRLWSILRRYKDLWGGKKGNINTVMHRIDLKKDAKTHMKSTYRTGPASPKFVADEVEILLDNGVIEPAQ